MKERTSFSILVISSITSESHVILSNFVNFLDLNMKYDFSKNVRYKQNISMIYNYNLYCVEYINKQYKYTSLELYSICIYVK
jgi:hypothetical protein